MDWTDQPELLAIFQQEIEDRAQRLIEAARAMLERQLVASVLPEIVRHAHTVKGSAKVMGLGAVSAGAATLERAWRAVQEESLRPSEPLARALEGVASQLVPAVERERSGDTIDIAAATTALEMEMVAVAPAAQSTTPSTSPPATPTPPARPTIEHPSRQSPPPPPPVPSASVAEVIDPTGLGGLLSSIEGLMIGTAMRVDSGDLYRLINLAVEVNLDTGALLSAHREGHNAERILGRLSEEAGELQEVAVTLAQAPLREATETFPQFVRYLSRRTSKEIRFELVGDQVLVDRQVLDVLREPLRHLIVNAVDHGIESPAERVAAGKPPTGTVSLHAQLSEGRLVVTVSDDGKGVDWHEVSAAAAAAGLSTAELDLSSHLFSPGFSTLITSGDFSGDGVGLAAVGESVERLNGGIRLESRPGEGTTVVVTVPATLALQNILLVKACGEKWGVPETAVLATFPVSQAELRASPERMELWFQGESIPIVSLASVLGAADPDLAAEVLVLSTRAGSVAITVPELVGRRRVALKSLGPILSGTPHLAAAAVLGGGEIVVVVEPNHLGDRARRLPLPAIGRPRVLVVDDSRGVRQLVSATLSSKGFDVMVAADASEAAALLAVHQFDAMVVDYSMPGSDGVELVRSLRAARQGLPIVMVSSVAGSSDQARAWEAGVDAYLDKFDLRKGALAATLRSLLEMRRGVER